MNHSRKKKNRLKSVLAVLLSTIVLGGVVGIASTLAGDNGSGLGGGGSGLGGGGSTNDTVKEQIYTVEAPAYANLQRFAYFADEDGVKVSEKNPYRYKAVEEQDLTPAYEEFMDVKVQVNTTTGSTYTSDTYTYYSGGWYDLGYVTEPLKYGMTVSFDVVSTDIILFGISELSRIENSADYGWGTDFSKLFVPQYNVYNSVSEVGLKGLVCGTSSMGKNLPFTDCTVPLFTQNVVSSVKIVFADELKVYIDDVLLSTSNDLGWDLDRNKSYYLSMSGNYCTYTLTEFGYDKDTAQETYGTGATLSSFEGKKITFLGDSITQGVVSGGTSADRYSTLLCTELGATEHNMGISGTVLCTGHASRSSRIKDVASIPDDSDYVFVLLGTNDVDVATAGFAELGKKGSTDTTTVWGAAQALCDALNAKFADTDTLVYILTPVFQHGDVEGDDLCGNGYSMRDFCNVLIETADENGIMCYDLNRYSGLVAADVPDGLHPNATGTAKMAQALKKVLLKGEILPYVPVK